MNDDRPQAFRNSRLGRTFIAMIDLSAILAWILTLLPTFWITQERICWLPNGWSLWKDGSDLVFRKADVYHRYGYTQYHDAVLFYWITWGGFRVGVAVMARRQRMMQQQQRRMNGLCPCCAYDLRATPDHCPECGWKESAMRAQ